MKLELFYVPTTDLGASLACYRDGLGFTEVWREGDSTAALTLPGGDSQIMLDASDPGAPAGPMLSVDSVRAFHADRSDQLTVLQEPAEIPGGFLAVYQDGGGTTIYVIDQSTDASAT